MTKEKKHTISFQVNESEYEEIIKHVGYLKSNLRYLNISRSNVVRSMLIQTIRNSDPKETVRRINRLISGDYHLEERYNELVEIANDSREQKEVV